MSRLILPAGRISQPQQGNSIDLNNPLSKGLAIAINGAFPSRNLVTNKPVIATNSVQTAAGYNGIGMTWSGLAFSGLQINGGTNEVRGDAGDFTGGITIVILANPVASTDRIIPFCWSPTQDCYVNFNANKAFAATSGMFSFRTSGNNGANFTGAVDGKPHVFAVVLPTGTTAPLLYRDGVDGTESPTVSDNAVFSASGTREYVGGYRATGNAVTGFNQYLTLAYNRALSPAEIKQLSADPWQVFQATPRNSWIYAIDGNTAISVGGGDLVLTSSAPTGVTKHIQTPSAGALAIASQTPTCSVGSAVFPAAGSVAITKNTPTVEIAEMFLPAAGVVALTPSVPALLRTYVTSPAAGELTLPASTPDRVTSHIQKPAASTLTVTGSIPTTGQSYVISPAVGQIAVTPTTPSFGVNGKIWSSIAQLGKSNDKTSGTSIVSGTLANAAAIGNVVIVAVARNNTATVDGDNSEVTSVTDTEGNTYTKAAEYTNSNGASSTGATVAVWYSVLTVALTTSSTITANFAGAVVASAMTSWGFSVVPGSTVSVVATTPNGDDVSALSSATISDLTSGEYLFVRADAAEDTVLSITGTSGYTTWETEATAGGSATTNMSIGVEHRILTGTGDTSSCSHGTADHAAVFVAFKGTNPHLTLLPVTGTLTLASSTPSADQSYTLSPPVSALGINGLIPVHAVGSIYAVPTATLGIDGIAPSASSSPRVYPATKDLAIAGIAPALGQSYILSPSVVNNVLTGSVPVIKVNHISLPSTSAAVLTTSAPLADVSYTLSPTVTNTGLTGNVPSVLEKANFYPATTSVVISGSAPSTGQSYTLSPSVSTTVITGNIPTSDVDSMLAVPKANVVISSSTPVVDVSYTLSPVVGAIDAAGQQPVAKISNIYISPTVSLAIVGSVPSVLDTRSFLVEAQSITITGNTPSLGVSYVLSPGAVGLSTVGVQPTNVTNNIAFPSLTALEILGVTLSSGQSYTLTPSTASMIIECSSIEIDIEDGSAIPRARIIISNGVVQKSIGVNIEVGRARYIS